MEHSASALIAFNLVWAVSSFLAGLVFIVMGRKQKRLFWTLIGPALCWFVFLPMPFAKVAFAEQAIPYVFLLGAIGLVIDIARHRPRTK